MTGHRVILENKDLEELLDQSASAGQWGREENVEIAAIQVRWAQWDHRVATVILVLLVLRVLWGQWDRQGRRDKC